MIRTTAVTEPPTRPPIRQQNSGHSITSAQRQNTRRPQVNTRLQDRPRQEPQQSPNPARRPTEPPRSTSEIQYRPQYRPEVTVSEIANEVRNRYPSTVPDSDFRFQQSLPPQNIRGEQREPAYNQRQPTRQRGRQYYYDTANRETQPQYSTLPPTTPFPSPPPRQRSRHPEQYTNRQPYQENTRQANREPASPDDEDRPFYGYRPTSPPYGRSRAGTSTAKEQSTERHPATNMYFVTSTPRYRSTTEVAHTRPHESTMYERQKIRPQAQIERPPHEYVSAEPIREDHPKPQRYYSQQRPSSSVENDDSSRVTAEDPRIRHYETERRPGYRGASVNERPKYRPEIERGFLPVSERPPREYSYANPESEYSHASRDSDRKYPYATSAPAREYVARPPEKEYSYNSRNSERENLYVPTAPELELLQNIQNPERDRQYSTKAPASRYAYATDTPNREYQASANERSRGNKYHNLNDNIPTTESTTTVRTTKKPRPPPPRPTFPSFPTFPPPPRRTTTTPPQTEPPKYENESKENHEYSTEYPVTTQKALKRQKYKTEVETEISEPRYVTENYLQTDSPEVTTRRRSRKRRPRPRRPTSTIYPENEDVVQVESVTQATTHKETTTRSTPSNYNRWRKQTAVPQKVTSTTTTTTTPSSLKPNSENSEKAEEYGSRINLFGRPRTRKPAVFTSRNPTTTIPQSNDQKRTTRTPTVTRTRKPFVKKVRKKLTTTTETPDATEPIARSDQNSGLHFNSDVNLQGLESATQLLVENMDTYQTTEAYNGSEDIATELSTINYQDDLPTDSNAESGGFESTRSVSKKFQNRPRILKFGKPRLRTADSSGA